MSEREHIHTDLEQELREREHRIGQISRRTGEHAGPGQSIRCVACACCYRIAGIGSGIPDCPYCGAVQP